MSQHDGKVTYKCIDCGSEYRRSDSLKKHRNSKHPDQIFMVKSQQNQGDTLVIPHNQTTDYKKRESIESFMVDNREVEDHPRFVSARH
jgi:uncharacterized C2H2 Zn-finger protein